jgi:Matrixin
MIGQSGDQVRSRRPLTPDRRSRPLVEGLESRLLLYATLGANWTYGSRITYSLVPDGTLIGSTPSTLFQSFTTPTQSMADWQLQFQKAALVWQQVANINLVWVSDDGSPIGVSGNQQGDSRFGDIRISAIPLDGGTLGVAYSPPPTNGGTAAGDIVLNSTLTWRINSYVDIETVAIHEFGHALGMSHSQITTAVMYAYYNSIKQNLTSDDTSGIQSVYGARQYDAFNSNGKSNGYFMWANSLDYLRGANNQILLPGLDITSPAQSEWYWVTVPASNSGTFTAVAQATNLSLLTPTITVYDSNMQLVKQNSSTSYGGTAWVSLPGVAAGQGYFIRVTGTGGGGMVGGYGLLANFGSQPLPTLPPPNTTVASKPDAGGGMSAMESSEPHELVSVGGLEGWGDALMMPGYGTDHEHSQVGAPVAPPSRASFMRFMAAPTSDPTQPAVSLHSLVPVAAERPGGKARPQSVKAISKALTARLSTAPGTVFSGKMKVLGSKRT